MSVFGDTYMSLRVLSRLCILLALGLGLIFLWRQTHNLFLTSMVGLVTAMATNLGDAGFYNWDTGAYPIEALGTIALMFYIRKPGLRNLIVLGGLGGFMVAFRLPLVAFIAIIGIAILGVNRRKTIFIHLIIVFVSFLIVWLLCILIMTGSITAYLESFKPENIITGHSLSVVQPYIDQFVRYFPRFVYFASSTLVACLLGLVFSYWKKTTIREFVVSEFLLLVIVASFCLEYISSARTTMPGICLPLFLLFVFWSGIRENWDSIKVNEPHQKLKSTLLFLIMLLEGLGSDTFFYRWSIVFLLPIAVGVVWPKQTLNSKKAFKLIFAILIPILAILVPIKNKLIVSDAEKLDIIKPSRIGGIYVPYEVARTYEIIDRVAEDLNRKNLKYEFIGQRIRYMYSYNYNDGVIDGNMLHCYHYEDADYRRIKNMASMNDVVIVLGDYPLTIKYLIKECNYSVVEEYSGYSVLRSLDRGRDRLNQVN